MVNMTKFVKKVSKLVKCLCQVGAFLLESSGRLNDLLVDISIAICEVNHTFAKDHGIMIMFHRYFSFGRDYLRQRFSILRLLEYLGSLKELLLVIDRQEAVQADRRL